MTIDDEEIRELEVRLGYWIAHTREHCDEFRQWAQKAGDAGQSHIHDQLLHAAQRMDEAVDSLSKALEQLRNVK